MDAIGNNAIDLMNKILDEVCGNYKDALFVACSMVEMDKPKVKRKRGRPVELVYPDNVNKLGLGLPKTLRRKLAKSSKIGAPQKYDYGGRTTTHMAEIVWRIHRLSPDKPTRMGAARSLLKSMSFYKNEKQVKQLADLASRVSSD